MCKNIQQRKPCILLLTAKLLNMASTIFNPTSVETVISRKNPVNTAAADAPNPPCVPHSPSHRDIDSVQCRSEFRQPATFKSKGMIWNANIMSGLPNIFSMKKVNKKRVVTIFWFHSRLFRMVVYTRSSSLVTTKHAATSRPAGNESTGAAFAAPRWSWGQHEPALEMQYKLACQILCCGMF